MLDPTGKILVPPSRATHSASPKPIPLYQANWEAFCASGAPSPSTPKRARGSGRSFERRSDRVPHEGRREAEAVLAADADVDRLLVKVFDELRGETGTPSVGIR